MKEGKMMFGETLDYEDIKHISGAIYAGMSRPDHIDPDERDLTQSAGYDTVRVA
jgi:hypothetical protein